MPFCCVASNLQDGLLCVLQGGDLRMDAISAVGDAVGEDKSGDAPAVEDMGLVIAFDVEGIYPIAAAGADDYGWCLVVCVFRKKDRERRMGDPAGQQDAFVVGRPLFGVWRGDGITRMLSG